ncbi:hypothetical protein [Saccharopolyspora phatthalungensis]|uniref:FMN phosphatase YigB (HAD superfamily) n=1 Tax=Saccharopolyspora phatthalungensis TaxID=664693 RepID=A0A840QJD9_9PSEU|nr:hypothetical protein [Saccharopolyspora phatthalungensis]MBB5159099.1 FMN phosphatase YigB (HAD superfamily) [Saccharopolyspora phatthalungensis]
MICAVIFDVGETLVDETREYGTWADWLGVPRHTFSAVFGAAIARGQDYRQAFQYFQPGFDLGQERQRRADAGQPESFDSDLADVSTRTRSSSIRACGVWDSSLRTEGQPPDGVPLEGKNLCGNAPLGIVSNGSRAEECVVELRFDHRDGQDVATQGQRIQREAKTPHLDPAVDLSRIHAREGLLLDVAYRLPLPSYSTCPRSSSAYSR